MSEETDGQIDGQIVASMERMMKRFHSMTPEERAEAERRSNDFDRDNRLYSLRGEWNVPERQLRAKDLDRSGAWGAKEAELAKMIGNGFLVALVGGRGPGKTQMGVELMKKCTEKYLTAYYDTLTGLFLKIKATFKRDSHETEDDLIKRMAKPQLLVLDEISRRSDSDWENRMIYELIDRRYYGMKDTLLIANQSKAQFLEAIGESLASRMQETGGIVECNWQSYRL